MRISHNRILSLQQLLNEICNLDLTTEEAQDAGMAIIRFVTVKRQAEHAERLKLVALIREEHEDG